MKPKRPLTKPGRKGRLLTILLIDDENPKPYTAPDSFFRRNFAIESIGSWADAQKRLGAGTGSCGADLLLVDVAWRIDDDLDLILKEEPNSPVQPVGPLLALPFISQKPIMACSVYSAHLDNKLLREHHFFLLTMGLIAAKTEGVSPGNTLRSRHLENMSHDGTLDQFLAKHAKNFVANAGQALDKALHDYRDRLETMVRDGDVTVTNREEVLQRLQEIFSRGKSGTAVIADDTIFLELAGNGWGDAISLRSLFADGLEWGGESLNAPWAKSVTKWVSELGESAIEQALRVVKAQDEAEQSASDWTVDRPAADKMIRRLYGKHLSKGDLSEVLRNVILFANIYANEATEQPRRNTVYDRMGGKCSQNSYLKWFGERRAGAAVRGPFEKLRPLAHSTVPKERCFLRFGDMMSESDCVAAERFRIAEGLDPVAPGCYRTAPATK